MKFYRRGEGRWLVLAFLVGLAFMAGREVYPFLARQAPVPAATLVVEGWVSDELLAQAAEWAAANGVQKIVATGGPLETGSYLVEWKTYAEMTRARMEALGLGAKFELAAVPAEKVRRGRTRESVRALRAAGAAAGAFNVASAGPHARRSWRAFRDEFGDGAEVGCVALEPTEYGGTDWWRCSEGVRDVIGEAIAYACDLLPGSGGE